MSMEIKPLVYSHVDGHTDICYSNDGSKLISCGADGDVRLWNGFNDEDPLQRCFGEFVLCVKHINDHIIIGTDDSKAQLISYPSCERDGILARFTAPINHISIARSHNWVALASDDMSVQVIETSSKETKNIPLINAVPLSVAIDDDAKFLSVSYGDGKLIIYDLHELKIIKEIPKVVPIANSFQNAKLLCRTDFDLKLKNYFAYPEKNKVIVLKTLDWTVSTTLKTEEITESFSIVTFSSCSNYIAACSIEGDIAIWNLSTQKLVGHKKHPKNVTITALSWNPNGNGDLAFSDAEGYIGLAVNCMFNAIPTKQIENYEEVHANMSDHDMSDHEVDFGDVDIANDDDDDEDNENAISLEKLKAETMGINEPIEEDTARSPSPRPRSRTPEPPLQDVFMPSSTPEHLDPRYLCWNEVGVIRCFGSNLDSDEGGSRSIETEFHDTTLHNSMMMSNYQNYTMGSLSTACLLVANANGAKVIPLGSSTKEWHINIPEEDEEIIAIATSHNLVCLATNKYKVHVFTIYGVQKTVFSIPGPLLCMSAFGHIAMVAYHSASSRKGDQCVEIMLVKMEGMSVECKDLKSALSPESTLMWLGFSDVGTPALIDSSGILYLYPLQSNIWLPFCDTTKHRISPIDGFFVVAVFETYGTVRGIRCKGSQYPGFTPRPTVSEIELRSPFLELNTEKAQLESNLFTWSVLQVDNTTKKYKETALKAFALATKNNLDQRAIELMECLQNEQILNLAIKYVNKLDKKRMADKLMELASKINTEDDILEEPIVKATPSSIIKPNRKLLLSCASKILLAKSKGISTPTQGTSPIVFSNTPKQDNTQESIISTPLSASISPQEMSILNEEPKNPFLKSLRKPDKQDTYNPLSLTDKFAGVEREKENKSSDSNAEKRKKSADKSPVDKGKEKQRKLDRFMFSKRT